MKLADTLLDIHGAAIAAAQMIKRANCSTDAIRKAVLYKVAVECLVDKVIVPLAKALGDGAVYGVDLPSEQGFRVVAESLVRKEKAA